MVASTPLEFTANARNVMRGRNTPLEWVFAAYSDPDLTEEHPDGTRHFLKRMIQAENRFLRVVVNPTPRATVVTAFLDRRLKRQGQ